MTKINISIPKPCHENWDAMSSQGKDKFCASCQKKVIDFTSASDREIVTAFQQNKKLCGRFLDSQLDRDLVKPEKKNPVWLATATALISIVGLNEVKAQEPVKTEQRQIVGKPMPPKTDAVEFEITGTVLDNTGLPMPGVNVVAKGTGKSTQTDFDGKYTIVSKKGNLLVFSFTGYRDQAIEITSETASINITMDNDNVILEGMVLDSRFHKKRTFFGRIFHAIGNLFR
ncbi:MAG: carboxypeptidase-like regulatory domain-containing protein [Flavobacterium sp.]